MNRDNSGDHGHERDGAALKLEERRGDLAHSTSDAEYLIGLGESHYDEFERKGDLSDIQKAIECITRAVDLTKSNHPDLPSRLNNLGTSYLTRFLHLGELEDIERAIEHQSRAVALSPGRHTGWPTYLSNLGSCYSKRFEHLGTLDDLVKSIEYGSRAVELAPDSYSGLPKQLDHLALSYRTRFLHLGELEDIEQAIMHQSRTVALTSERHTSFLRYLSNLGLYYSDRFNHLDTLDDLVKSTECGTRAVDLTPDGHPELPRRLNNLGMSYRARFLRLGKLEDIEQAIVHQSSAVALTPERHTNLPTHLSNLGLYYSDRFNRLNTPDDIVKSIEYGTRAVDLTPNSHPGLPIRLNNLGSFYRARFLHLGKLEDIEQAIVRQSRAVTLTSERHTSLPAHLSNLGLYYSDRFNHLNTLDDIAKSIEYGTRAVDLTPNSHPDLPIRLNNLGSFCRTRFLRLGELEDIEQAIMHQSRAVTLTSERHTSLPTHLSNLGLYYFDRFNHLDTLDDLVKSTEYGARAVELTPDSHPDLPIRLNNLGSFYRARFLRLGKLEDIEQAIVRQSRAVTLTSERHTSLPAHLSNLGLYYSDRFNRLNTPDDIVKSIEYGTRAVDLTPNSHPDLPIRLNNLGSFHRDRFLRLGELEDIEQAIVHQSRAVALTPDVHPRLSLFYGSLAITSLTGYQRTHDPSHLQYSLESFREGVQLSVGPPRERFQCALNWAGTTSSYGTSDCMQAYRTTIDLLPQFIWLGAPTSQRYHDLTITKDLAANAANAAILHSDLASALEWLEHARCVVWSQGLMLRSPLDLLQSSHPSLAARIQALAQQLQGTTSDSSAATQPSMAGLDGPEQEAKIRRSLATEYSDVLAEARSLPGFEDFLRPTKVNGLVRVPRTGPVVVINCHEHRCDALIIMIGEDSIKHLSLPAYNRKKAQKARTELQASLSDQGLRERGFKIRLPSDHKDSVATMLQELWTHVVKPILDFIGCTNDRPVESLPHITWCPTGVMTFLPLHAAGDYAQTRSSAFDYAISSYTPTLSALLRSTPAELTHTSRVLAIGQEHTPGHNPLYGTVKELESVKGHTQVKMEYAQLLNREATVATVLGAMEQHDWVHLACHAHQNVGDPTKSGFYLHDGTLDLAAINRRSFKNKGLAFLSACQTATGDEQLPDEAIHLASGMLMAGYSSVIATMWSVMDEDAPFIADKVYAELMREGKVGNGEAGRALHSAVSTLRQKVGVKEFGRWVPYIHIGS